MKLLNWIQSLLAITLLLTGISAQASYLNPAQAINKAAWQGALSQRAAKTYLMASANVDYDHSSDQLRAAISEFDLNLLQLENAAPTAEIVSIISRMKTQWSAFQAELQLPATTERAQWIIEESNSLLLTSHQLVREWSWLETNALTDVIELANQQGMLSERVGMYYAAHYYGIQENWVINELNTALKEFSAGLHQLQNKDDLLPELNESLASATSQWEYTKHSLLQFNKGHYVPVMISVTTESLLEEMNGIAMAYTETATIRHTPEIEVPTAGTELAAVISQ